MTIYCLYIFDRYALTDATSILSHLPADPPPSAPPPPGTATASTTTTGIAPSVQSAQTMAVGSSRASRTPSRLSHRPPRRLPYLALPRARLPARPSRVRATPSPPLARACSSLSVLVMRPVHRRASSRLGRRHLRRSCRRRVRVRRRLLLHPARAYPLTRRPNWFMASFFRCEI